MNRNFFRVIFQLLDAFFFRNQLDDQDEFLAPPGDGLVAHPLDDLDDQEDWVQDQDENQEEREPTPPKENVLRSSRFLSTSETETLKFENGVPTIQESNSDLVENRSHFETENAEGDKK